MRFHARPAPLFSLRELRYSGAIERGGGSHYGLTPRRMSVAVICNPSSRNWLTFFFSPVLRQAKARIHSGPSTTMNQTVLSKLLNRRFSTH